LLSLYKKTIVDKYQIIMYFTIFCS